MYIYIYIFVSILTTIIYVTVDCSYDVHRCFCASLSCQKDHSLTPSMLRCSNQKNQLYRSKTRLKLSSVNLTSARLILSPFGDSGIMHLWYGAELIDQYCHPKPHWLVSATLP